MLLYGLALEGVGYFSNKFWTYIYLLTSHKKKNLVSVLNWLPPVIFSPLCLEPAPMVVPSLSFYLVSRSFFYFCLASKSIRLSWWYLLCIFFIAPILWNVKSSCCLSIHLGKQLRISFPCSSNVICDQGFLPNQSCVRSLHILWKSVCVPSHSLVFVLNLSLPVKRLPS